MAKRAGALLSTACGSPSYVAPEVRSEFSSNQPRVFAASSCEQLLTNKGYDGAAADVWSCGVILFELLAGDLPFDDCNLINLYRKVFKAAYTFPEWFTKEQKQLISRILNRNPKARLTTSEIIDDQWFRMDYKPAERMESNAIISMDDVHAAFNSLKGNEAKKQLPRATSFINAFQLIAMSDDLDLSGLFEEQDDEKQKTKLGSKHTVNETIEKIEAAAKHVSLSVNRTNNSKMKMHPKERMTRCSRSFFDLSAEVTEVTPTHCVIEISKSAGELGLYNEFCNSLSCLLKGESGMPTEIQEPHEVKSIQEANVSS